MAEVESMLPINLEVSERLSRAVQALAYNKFVMDRDVHQHSAGMLAGDLHDGAYGPAEPLPFLARVLPFMWAAAHAEGREYALVPTANTLGCSWRWRRRSLDDEKAQRLVQQLTDSRALQNDSLDRASYALVRPLGIFAPHEGKNRVDFLREEGIELIPAEVSYIDYPSADRLKLYRVAAGTFAEIWAVLDARWVERVPHPSWAIPLLNAYWVSLADEWPAQLAPIGDVMEAFLGRRGSTQALGHPDYRNAAVVDLEALNVSSEYQAERVPCPVIELQHAKVDPRFWLSAGAGLFVSTLATMWLPAGWIEARLVAGMALGAAFGALVAAVAPILRVRRRFVRNQSALPLRLAPKRRRPVMMDRPGE
ncbi:hypothetical protein [Pseudomonas aeruginosa]|uniref:hypothetical protein n=1 Tax=Pseudomonas aeruginosa TaxID=287 RepID=UPI0008FB3020|nr:hypothetical protein [Pseudomonas aeruginosa]